MFEVQRSSRFLSLLSKLMFCILISHEHLAHLLVVDSLLLAQIRLLLDRLLNVLVLFKLEEFINFERCRLIFLAQTVNSGDRRNRKGPEHLQHMLTVIVNIVTKIAREHRGEP